MSGPYTHRTACRKCGCYLLAPVEWQCHCKAPEPYDAWSEITVERHDNSAAVSVQSN